MKLIPSQLGADRKKLAYLGVLVVVLIGVFVWNREPSAPEAHTAAPLAVTPVAPVSTAPRNSTGPAVPQRSANGRAVVRSVDDFKPSLKPKDGVDVSKIDPTLRLDLLAKLKEVPLETGPRGSVFDWGKAPPPPPQDVPKIQVGPMPSAGTKSATISANTDPPKPPPPPPPPPIPLKFYGYSARSGTKRAFFLDGDEIAVAGENDVIKNRYKIIRIGVNSVVVEDMTTKNEQTLPLIEELAG